MELTGVPLHGTHDDVTTPQPHQPYGPVVAATLWVYVGPCIFIIGLCGNILILLVMSQRRMRGTSTCVFLRWMACADLCVLVSGMITEWVEALFDITFKVSNVLFLYYENRKLNITNMVHRNLKAI